MNISAPFIARPVATALLAIALLIAGILGYRALPVASLPEVDFPTILVTTKLPGANPDTISKLITAPLERQFGEMAGLAAMSSISSAGTSAITLRFDLTGSLDSAAQDVQAAINAAAGTLPQNLQYPPVYTKVNPADAPILSLALTSDTIPLYDIANDTDRLLVPQLSQIVGVGQVLTEGGLRRAVRIAINPARLAAYGLSLEDVRTAITNANQSGAKGGFDGPAQSFSLGADDQLNSIAAYRQVIIAYHNAAPVRLSAVGTVAPGLENNSVLADYNNKPAVILDIQRQPGANIVATVAAITDNLADLKATLPAGIKLQIIANRTATIKASVHDVQIALISSALLVIFVIFLFLPHPRAVIIPAVALPLSIVATFAVMKFLGYGLDNLSLMALTVASGFVVDDAIVMIENIVRFIEAGESPLAAAYHGARQIGFTIVSLTVSLIAVFIPLLFMPGIIGRLFSEFSVTLAVAVIISAIVSLTLTPMMCGVLLRPQAESRPSRLARYADAGLLRVRRSYGRALARTLAHRGLVMALFLATIAGTILLYLVVPKALLPQEDTGQIVAVTQGAPAISLPAMALLQSEAVAVIRANHAVAGVTSLLGAGVTNPTPNTGRLTITLKPIGRRAGIAAVMAQLQSGLTAIPGLRFYLQPVQDITLSSRVSPTQFQYTITDTDRAELQLWSAKIETAMAHLPQLTDLATDQQNDGVETYVAIDRAAAARLGVNVQSIENILYDAYGQRQISTIYQQSNQYRVVLEVDKQARRSPAALAELYVPGNVVNGVTQQIPLLQLARISQRVAPLVITRENQFPAVTISFNLAPGIALGNAESAITRTQARLGVPPSITGTFSGAAASFQTALAAEPWLIAAALLVIYIVLGVLYESTIHPITILSTLPSAGIGALLALILTGTDFTLVALVGIVLLMGIVKKNGIIMVDFAIEAERVRGLSPEAAITEACLLRFRPIMMTTLAALFGALPLIIEGGAGAELRTPLGITIIGGLLLSQLLTLFTTPVVYLALDRTRLRARRSGTQAAPT
ncbi:MAG: acriflavine resistance protein B [Rhodospirillales bacterium 20-60-12]|nr:MAG: acriflavine resistance protein B [Rhodospirillales bacterium 20-60-12]HQT67229.1 efflux RND transporter permease subunit [Acetobacteraceae bacterium]